jgi:hypothetical protein
MASLNIYVVVGHHVVGFMQVLETSPVGQVLSKFSIDSIMFLFLQRRAHRSQARVP